MTTSAPITYEQIEAFADDDEFMGFGFIGHSRRRHRHDVALAEAANRNELQLDEVFLWANSRWARHFMDQAFDATGEVLVDKLERALFASLPDLIAETE